MLLTREEIIDELRKQDEELDKIFARRKVISKMCMNEGKDYYETINKELYSDGNNHHTF